MSLDSWNEFRLTFMKIHKNIFLSIYRTDPCVYKGFPKLLNAKVTRMDIKSLFNYVYAEFLFLF